MSKRQVIEELMSQIDSIQSGASRKPERSTKRASSPQCECSEKPDALKRIVAWVNVSERSTASVRERLEREGYDQREIEEAIGRATDYGYIDDMRFASSLIRGRLAQRKGSDGIRRELAGHGIEIEDVPGWPYEFIDDDDEFERALAFLESHPPRSKNKRDGAYRKLVQRGFSSSLASSAARQWYESVC